MAIVNLPPGGIALKEIEQLALLQALAQCGWNQRRAAEFLRLSSRVMSYKVRKHGIAHPSGTWRHSPDWQALAALPPLSLGKWRTHQRVPGGARLTPSDVEGIHEAAADLPGLTLGEQARCIHQRSKGLLGAWQTIYDVLRGGSWRQLHPRLSGGCVVGREE